MTRQFWLFVGMLLPAFAAINADDTPPPREMAIPFGMRLSPGPHFIPYSAMNPNDLGERKIRYDTTGMRQISPAPPPGVHPRMLQSPEDREPMREALPRHAARPRPCRACSSATPIR